MELTSLATDLLPGLSEAYAALDRGAGATKEVYVFGDMQKLGWDRQSAAVRAKCEEIRRRATLLLVRCGDPNRQLQNVAITDITYPGGIPHTGTRMPFTVLVRNEIFRFVRALARGDLREAARLVAPAPEAEAQEAQRIQQALAPFFEAHRAIRVDPEARSPKHTKLERGTTEWRVRQILLDTEEDNDWYFDARIDLDRSRELARPALVIEHIGT